MHERIGYDHVYISDTLNDILSTIITNQFSFFYLRWSICGCNEDLRCRFTIEVWGHFILCLICGHL